MTVRALVPIALLLAQPAVAAAAETRMCLPLSNIRETIVRSDRSIDFKLRDGSVWRNTLPNRCVQLGMERAFSYQTSINQLCRQDQISVLVQSGGALTGARCGLGPFERLPPPPPKPK